ncbi:hypothetical protein VWN77_10450, partial [Campylobacter coli]
LLSQNIGEFIHLLIFLFVLFALSCIDLKFQAVPQKLLWLIFFLACLIKYTFNLFLEVFMKEITINIEDIKINNDWKEFLKEEFS